PVHRPALQRGVARPQMRSEFPSSGSANSRVHYSETMELNHAGRGSAAPCLHLQKTRSDATGLGSPGSGRFCVRPWARSAVASSSLGWSFLSGVAIYALLRLD